MSENAAEAAKRVKKGLGICPIGVALLSRLAVDLSVRGRGLGKALLKHALSRINGAIEILSGRAAVVHVLDN